MWRSSVERVAVLVAALTACFPALFSAARLPADAIGKEN